jgi:pseudouridine-5'-phosphate glycosidase
MLRPGVLASRDVQAALASEAAVVALESTIITHGLPYPVNAETALEAERIARGCGAVPATIAIIDGQLRAGLSEAEIRKLASAKDAAKASRRDIASLMVRRASAGTTVAATMFIAARAGIRVFATGGIGGVHRGADKTFDISADLGELARTPVAVVSAGVKLILDIAKTAELLESLGVPVIGYRTSEFPAFFSTASGGPIDHHFESAEDIARVMALHWEMGGGSGLLIANPIPEADAIEAKLIEGAIEQALARAKAKGISQKDVTPFLLSQVQNITAGRSVQANIKLILHNVQVACEIAIAYQKVMRSGS